MPRSTLSIVLAVLLTGVCSIVGAQGVAFSENKGQWDENVLYRSKMAQSALFVERSAFTYVLWSGGEHVHHGHEHLDHEHEPLRSHAYKVHFIGGKAFDHFLLDRAPHYENYFLGNDPAKWAGNVPVGSKVELVSVWPGVDAHIHGGTGLKYDFVVTAGIDPQVVQLNYEGTDKMHLNANGNLVIQTSAGVVTEEAPFAYQFIDGELTEVPCFFKLKNNTVSFEFPAGYDDETDLIIDPILGFSSYVGSSGDNFGFTATYDDSGHLYGGGIVFNPGYPTTPGVLGPAYNNALSGCDMGLSKFLPDGSALVWSTYLGGTGNESPHSLVVNSNDELYVLGATGSSDFPISAGAYDSNFGGGPSMTWAVVAGGYGFNYSNGTDIVLAHLTADATGLVGSSFIGGSGNDGLNNDNDLAYNYGDVFRGEVALDANENPVVATSTHSSDAPTAGSAPQAAYGGGGQDGYVFRMNPALTNLQWATFVGGSGSDSGFGLQFDSNGNIYVTGGTTSSNMPMVGSAADNSHNGDVDGYIVKYNPSGTTLLGSTFLGTGSYDQTYFVQLSITDEVYVVGQSEGSMTVTPGKYNNPNSNQFVQKYNNALSNQAWSTVIGTGNGTVDISPTAFLVSDCGQIYISGWGGATNNGAQPNASTTVGLPVTADAFQSTTTPGGDFYLMLLNPDADGLAYATFFGGSQSAEHVDGGTSRFNKDGTVYQAVCAGCGSNDDFPSTPGAWSPNNPSPNCNLGVFKFNLSAALAIIGINGPTYLCLPNATAQFTNSSIGGTNYFWDFGDFVTSNDSAPTHTYSDTGTYIVSMVLTDSLGCLIGDTAFLTINVYDPLDAQINPPDTVCAGTFYQLQASGGLTYEWIPTTGLSDPNIANPTVTINSTSTYSVVVTDSCGTDTATTTITVSTPSANAGPDQSICVGDSVLLQGPSSVPAGFIVQWSPTGGLSNSSIAQPMASPNDTTTYTLSITDAAGCMALDSMTVFVQAGPPVPITQDTVTCIGQPVQLTVSGGDSYSWIPDPNLSSTTIQNPSVSPQSSSTYYVTMTNLCGSVQDSVFVLVPIVTANAWPNDTICPGDSIPVFASGGVTYQWSPSSGILNDTSGATLAFPSVATTYTVTAFDQYGCSDDAQLTIDLYPQPTVNAGVDVFLDFGQSTQLTATGNGALLWTPDTAISCLTCPDPIVQPQTTTTYYVQLTDENGCTVRDAVTVFMEGSLYVPNTFTPDGDGVNDLFFALATEVSEFEIYVFNRWGELIWEANDHRIGWDGTYKGTLSQIGTYVWRVRMRELNGTLHNEIGHVNLIR